MFSFDVAIIGAGPAGSSAAIALARMGYSVALADKEQFPREKLCGDFINPINWPILHTLGVERDVLACAHQKVTGFRITSVAGDEAESPLPLRDDGLFGLGLRRLSLDHILLKNAESENVTVLQGRRIKSLKREERGWNVEFDSSGTIDTHRARLLIGADGRNSWVARHLGMTRGAAMRGRAVAFQLRLECRGGLGNSVEIHLFPGGYAGLLGLGEDMINLCLTVDKNLLLKQRPLAWLLESRLPQNPHLKKILSRSECAGEVRSTYPVYFSPRRSYSDGALLVGDAARVSEPVTGEGIYFAMKSGLLAAETIDRAFRAGDFSAARLGAYEAACRTAFCSRRVVNAFFRALMYHPALVSPVIRFSAKRRRLLDSIVRTVCLPDAAR